MRKYRTYIILLIALSGIALYFWVTDKKSTMKVTSNYFAIADTGVISAIRIIKNTDTLFLEKTNQNWVVNRAYDARSGLVRNLLKLLTQIETGTPAPKQIKNDLISSYSENPISATFYSTNKPVKTLRMVESDSILRATVMFTEEKNEPYTVRIPGFDGRISMLFQTNPLLFRDKTIFRLQPYEILFVKVEYPKTPDKSFMLNVSNPKDITVQSLVNNTMLKLQKEQAIQYLLNFANVPFEFVEANKRARIADSLKISKPSCIITLKDITNREIQVKTYPIAVQSKKQMSDLFKMYVVLQNDSFPVTTKYTDFDPITKELSDFSIK